MPPGRALAIWLAYLSVLLLLFTGAQLTPAGYLLAGILAPLPVLLASERLGYRAALLLLLATAAFMVALKPGLEILWQNLGVLNLLLMGFLLGFWQHQGYSAPRAIIQTVLVLMGLALLLLVGQAIIQGMSLQTLLAQRGAEIMASVRQVLGERGGSAASLIPGMPQAEVERLLQRLLPALVVTNTGLVAWLNVVLVRQLLFRFAGRKPEPPMYLWALPEWFIFVFVGAGFLIFIPGAPLRLVSLNLLVVLAVLYFCQGVAVAVAWFNRLGLPRILRLIGYPLMFLNPLCFLIITLGVLDLWLDFRRLHQQPGDAGGGIES